MSSICDGCGESLIWAKTPKGATAPIEYSPSAENGNVLVLAPSGLGATLAVTLSGDSLQLARERRVPLRLNHYATCPERDRFKTKGKKTNAKKGNAT